jgi:hypothetical protein
MKRREFIAAGAGGGVMLLAGAGAVLGGASLDDGPDFGPIPAPRSSGSTTLDNGRRASLYENGAIAFFGASIVSQFPGAPAIVGRLKNISGDLLVQVRVKLQFLADSDAVIAQGWVVKDDLPAGRAWQFVGSYPRSNPDRIAGGKIAAIEEGV